MIKQRRTIGLLLLVAIAIFFSCADKKEYNMELVFQREMTAKMLYDNDRILLRIEKEISDNGRRSEEVAILNHAQHIRDVRNKCIGSLKSANVLMENIKEAIQLAAKDDSNAVLLLNYYGKYLHEKNDSLFFQKFINVYLIFEERILNEDLSKVSRTHCGFGIISHIAKTKDSVAVEEIYELAVIPEIFDYKTSYISEHCEIAIYKDDVQVEMKYTVLKKGSVYLISLQPSEAGNYKIRGAFTLHSREHPYILNNVFGDRFVVKK